MTVKRQRFFPYACADRTLALDVRAVWAGEQQFDLDLVFDPELRTLDLRDHMGAAYPIRIELEITGIDGELFQTVFPAGERGDPPVGFVAVALDDGGWYRVTAPLTRTGDVALGTIEFIPADSTGFASLEVIALRTTAAAPDASTDFATGIGMRVASSPAIKMFTRERPQTPGGSLDIRWEDFVTSTHPPLNRRSDRVYYLETTAEPPILWMNRAFPDLAAVLESKATWGPRASIRDLLNQAIAGPVWYALLHSATVAVSLDEDGAPTVPEGWRRGLLARIAPRAYPGAARDRAYRHLLDEVLASREQDPNLGPALIERLVQAVQDELDLPTMTRRALKDLAR